MDTTEILAKVYELKESILDSKEYKDVKEKERLMEENCSALLIEYNHLFEEYNNALRFEKYGSNLSDIQKKLHECKLRLDTNPYVISYRDAYKHMQEILNEIQNTMYKDIIEK